MHSEQTKTQKRYLLPLLGFFLTLVLLFAFLFLAQAFRVSLLKQAVDSTVDINRGKTELISSVLRSHQKELDDYMKTINNTYTDPHYQRLDGFDIFYVREMFQNAQSASFTRALLFLRDGTVYNEKAEIAIDIPPELAALRSEKTAVSTPFYDPQSGAQVIAIFRPADAENQLIESVGALFLASDFYKQCGLVTVDGRATYVFDSEKSVIFDPNQYGQKESATHSVVPYVEAYGISDAKLSDIIREGGTDPENPPFADDGIIRIIASSVGASSDWFAITTLNSVDAMSGAESVVLQILIFLGILLLSFAILVLYYIVIGRRQLRRAVLAENMDSIALCANQTKFESDAGLLLQENPKTTFGLANITVVNFRYVHSVYGAERGDKLVQFLSEQIRKSLRGAETYGRLSDGSFVVLWSYADKDTLAGRFDEIYAAISQYDIFRSNRYHLDLHAGIYCSETQSAIAVSQMIERAIVAQQIIKPGKVLAFYDDEARAAFVRETQMEARMEHALKSGEFKVYLQPKYNLIHRQMDGAEALSRWEDKPGEHIFYPDEFIPLFEKNGFIAEFDFYLFDMVCKNLNRMSKEGKKTVPISVNVSRFTAMRPDFIDRYVAIKRRYNIPDGLMELEFTESFALEDYELLRSILSKAKQGGFLSAMDDFGSGFSSFKALKELDFDVIKLDKFFLSKSGNVQRDDVIISGVIAMLKEIGAKVVLEGVETEGELQRAAELHCDSIQGYLYSEALPVSDFESFAERTTEMTRKMSKIIVQASENKTTTPTTKH